MKKVIAMLLMACLMVFAAVSASALEFALGSEASEVSLIQEALLELDYYYGDITGHYGERTERGVRMFQEAHGLEGTGIADDRTRERLYLVAGVQAPPVSDTLLETNTTLRRGDSGIGVTWIQESLRDLGHYDGEISGTYGLLTHEAVRLFQRAHGLSSDGVAGRNTIKAIAAALEEKEAAEREQEQIWQDAYNNAYNNYYGSYSTPTPEPTIDPETITTLKLGVENSAVYRLQQDLERLGFYTGTVTGSFGRLTKEAVRLFQRAHDIPSDGVAGPVTLARIAKEIEALDRAQATPTPTPVPTAAPTPDPYNGLVQWITPVPTAAPTATPTPVPSTIVGVNSSVGFLSIERELELYDYSEDVRQLQLALNSLGYYSSAVSAYFDLGTQASVMSYQAAKGLSVTGVADKVTLITINDDIFRRVVNSVD